MFIFVSLCVFFLVNFLLTYNKNLIIGDFIKNKMYFLQYGDEHFKVEGPYLVSVSLLVATLSSLEVVKGFSW